MPVSSQTIPAFSGAAAIDKATAGAIQQGLIPGAVVVIGHQGQIVFRKAYGARALAPKREAATLDTIYDAASLTKVIATTPAIMKLVEQGKVRVDEPVTTYLPEFQGGNSAITVRELMTHFSGLRPDVSVDPPWSGYEVGIQKALTDKPAGPPGVKFVYSDINFELLGEIVRRVSGKPLNEFVQEQIYAPLGMRDTMYLPPAALAPRIAPTADDPQTGKMLRGTVHDPTARFMGGVAGHAGVFTTADDLARYCEMLLGLGQRAGVRVFSEQTVREFTTPASPAKQAANPLVVRSLGWDIDSQYSHNRGDVFPVGGYGHTGFTGPSIWIDPPTQSFIVIVTNRLHSATGKETSSNINPWRRQIATIAAESFGVKKAIAGTTLTGLDVLARESFAPLKGRRVGLITNQTGVDRTGRRNVDLMLAAGVKLMALYSPEHGITGKEDQDAISNAVDKASGLPIRSLYSNGRTQQMTASMLGGVDTLVFDIQDVGARFYTYSCAMLYALEEASKAKIPFYVLDRPNPVTGLHVEGPMLDAGLNSNVGCYELPVRHGMTLGELATMVNAERKLGADVHVIKMENWHRGDWFDATGQPWIDPSPNMRSLRAAVLYPGIALLEAAKDYSVGRGTDTPFEQIGAEWIDGEQLADYLNRRSIAGIHVYATRFQPSSSVLANRKLSGVRFEVTDRDAFDSVGFGLELAHALQVLYPGKIDFEACRNLIGSRAVVDALRTGQDTRQIAAQIGPALQEFADRRAKYLLY